MVAPVTKFDSKDLEDVELSEEEKSWFIPIFPNTVDVRNRDPIKTDPVWRKPRAYQMLVVLPVSPKRLQQVKHVTYVCDEHDFESIRQEMALLRKRTEGGKQVSTLNVHAPEFRPGMRYGSNWAPISHTDFSQDHTPYPEQQLPVYGLYGLNNDSLQPPQQQEPQDQSRHNQHYAQTQFSFPPLPTYALSPQAYNQYQHVRDNQQSFRRSRKLFCYKSNL